MNSDTDKILEDIDLPSLLTKGLKIMSEQGMFWQKKAMQEFEGVDSPKHYLGKTLEAIDVIEDFNLSFNLGNAIKYILRCEHKENKAQDLRKAIWYLQRECELL